MPRKNKQNSSQDNTLQILRGGKAVSKNLVQQCVADLQHRRIKTLGQRSSTERQMAKYLGQAQGLEKPDTKDPHVVQSLNGLLGIHEKLAKQKLAAPRVHIGPGGLLPGQITFTVVPPFDYDIIIPTILAGTQPTVEGTSDKNTGKMTASAISSSTRGFGGGSMYTTVGIYFHPLGPGTLTVHATPTYSYQWWTNSLQDVDLVRSSGSGALTVYGVDVASQTTGAVGTILSTAGTSFKQWDESQTSQVNFDFGTDLPAPTSVSLDVNHDLVYLVFVEADVHVEGVGWPGSLAGAKMSVTVPSITCDFRMRQVFEP